VTILLLGDDVVPYAGADLQPFGDPGIEARLANHVVWLPNATSRTILNVKIDRALRLNLNYFVIVKLVTQ